MKIYRKKDTLYLEYPLKTNRWNPYDEDAVGEEMDTLIGLISHTRNEKDEIVYTEYGLAHRIDRDYKGKDDEAGSFVIQFSTREELEQACKDLKLSWMEI